MSPLLKSELRLRVGARHCDAHIWRAGLTPRSGGHVFVQGTHDGLIDQALDALVALDESQGDAGLPAKAHIWIEDEQTYFASWPAETALKGARAAAKAYFADVLGDEDLTIDVSLTPCGTRWVAAAVHTGEIEAWTRTLNERGLVLHSVSPALLQDIVALRAWVPSEVHLLALVRAEGISLVDLHKGAASDLSWVRCDVEDLDVVQQRIEAHLARRADLAEVSPQAVRLVPLHAQQFARLAERFDPLGWLVLNPLVNEPEPAAA